MSNVSNRFFTAVEQNEIDKHRKQTEEALAEFQSEVSKMAEDYEEDGMIHNFEKVSNLLRRVERFSAMHTAVISLTVERRSTEEDGL